MPPVPHRLLCLASLLLLLLPSGAARADENVLEGRIALSGENAEEATFQAALVWWTPDGGEAPAPPERPFEMVTVRKEFLPRVLAVPVGSTVRFPNQDPILHNVFSVSPGNRFDLGLYGAGESKAATFERPGIVRVFCNVHHEMIAHVVVVETPHTTRPDRRGRFRLEGLPAGAGTLTVWHERAEPWTKELTLPAAGPLAVELPLTKPRIPRHLNKFGKPYKKKRGRRY